MTSIPLTDATASVTAVVWDMLIFIRLTHRILLNWHLTNAPYRCAAAI